MLRSLRILKFKLNFELCDCNWVLQAFQTKVVFLVQNYGGIHGLALWNRKIYSQILNIQEGERNLHVIWCPKLRLLHNYKSEICQEYHKSHSLRGKNRTRCPPHPFSYSNISAKPCGFFVGFLSIESKFSCQRFWMESVASRWENKSRKLFLR